MLELAQEQLIAMFGEDMRNPVHLQMLDWAKEKETAVPLDLNSQRSHPTYGLPPSLSRLWDGKVLLGSTETAPVHGGFLEGALEAAERVENGLLDAALEKNAQGVLRSVWSQYGNCADTAKMIGEVRPIQRRPSLILCSVPTICDAKLRVRTPDQSHNLEEMKSVLFI